MVLLSIAALTALVLGAWFLHEQGNSEESIASSNLTLTAIAHPDVSSNDLLGLEGQIVGRQAVVDPSTGRLPDVSAFHGAGVASMTIDNATLRVKMLPTASAAQRARVRLLLRSSPLIDRVEEATK